jgi:beta-glucanase (GH16 family)
MGRTLVLAFAIFVATAAVALAYPEATVTVARNSVTLGNLECATRYEIRVREYRSGAFRDARTYYPTTSACTVSTPTPTPSPTPEPTPDPAVVPTPIAWQGYSKVWEDEFNTLDPTVWRRVLWHQSHTPAVDEIFASNGTLKLATKRTYGYRPSEVSTDVTQAQTKAWQYGYIEARVKMTGGRGFWPAVWMLSSTHRWNPIWPTPACVQPTCLSAELDIFEGQGTEPNVFYGTLHRNSANVYGPDYQNNENNRQVTGTNLYDSWHTVSVKWTADRITWYLDDQPLHSLTPYDSTPQPMFLILSATTGGWAPGNTPDSTTPNDLITEVDWVRVWQQ